MRVYNRSDNNPILCLRKVKPFTNYSYPKENFVKEDHAYVVLGDQPILITKLFDLNEYNELSWLHKEKIRILSALSLSASGIGWYSLYAGSEAVYLTDFNSHSYDLRDSNVINNLLFCCREKLGIDYYFNSKEEEKVGNEEYICTPELLFDSIDINNDSLIKSLNYWLKACMLSQHRHFSEEATALLFFSLEGILKLFHAELQMNYLDARVTDVINFLIDTYDVPEGYEEYIKMCYELRNDYVHAFNSGWNGNFEADDMLETFNVLKDIIYIYLTRYPSIESSRNRV